MASAPNLRVTSSQPANGNGSAAPAETGDFFSRMLTAPSAGQAGAEDPRPHDGERDTQDDPTVVTFDAAAATGGAPAQDLLAGLIPIVQAQGDYPIAVTFAPSAPEPDDGEAAAGQGDPAEPILSIVPTTVAPPAVPIPTATAPIPGTPGAALAPVRSPEAKTIEDFAPLTPNTSSETRPAPVADVAGQGKAETAAAPSADKPIAAMRTIEAQQAVRATPEIAEAADGAEASAKPAEAAPLQTSTPPAPPVAAETSSRLQALRNALLPLRGAVRGDRQSAPSPVAEVAATPSRPETTRIDAVAPTLSAEARPAAEPQAPVAALTTQAPTAPTQRMPDAAPAETIERSIERALDLANDSEWLDRLSRDIAGAGERDGTLRFRLNPQTLGHLRVELSQTDQGTSVRLAVETEAARSLLADAQPRLLAEARAQGLRIAEASVHLAGSDQHQSGDPRRQEDARQGAIVRTPSAGDSETSARERPGRSRSDRYA